MPRWAFEKFPGTSGVLGTQMQSVGEAMAIGRTFPESLQKGMRSLEQGRLGLNCDPAESALDLLTDDELVDRAAIATPDRPFQLEAALRRGISVERIYEATRVDPWFLDQILRIVEEREHLLDDGLRVDGPVGVAAGEATRLLRRAAGLALGGRRGRGAVRPAWPMVCGPPSRRSTPAARSSPPRPRTTTRPTRTRTRWCRPIARR